MGYEEGLQAGKDIPSPIERLLGAVAGSYKKRREQREEQDKEERQLQNELIKLTTIENIKAKHEKEKSLLEGISKGEIEETTETGTGTFEGTPFGVMGKRYKRTISQTMPLTEEQAIANIPKGEYKEDYNIKPQLRTVKGEIQTTFVPERKKELPTVYGSNLLALRQSKQQLKDVMDKIEKDPEAKKYFGPGFIQSSLPGSDILAQWGPSKKLFNVPKKFVALKAELQQTFNEFRNQTTKSQASMREIQWLVPQRAKPTDTWENLKQKIESDIDQSDLDEQTALQFFSETGYATGKLRKGQRNTEENNDPLGIR